ncbi:MAG: murein biosynthesis integral membrane protein MurJ [Holophagaceae bacterium]|nr:murein biosynthesis integral membrane protein MurJ [Holophagaceae bacterium]
MSDEPPLTRQPSLMRSAAVVSAMTLLSRLSGFAQTYFLSYYLGAGAAADAYAVAFRLPNLLRRFAAEGTMTAAFLPTLTELEAKEGEAATRATAARFLGTLLTLITILVIVVMLSMGLIAGLLVVGRLQSGVPFSDKLALLWRVLSGSVPPPPEMALTVRLGRIMFPYLALVSLTAGFGGLLNLRGRFALASSVSVFWNLAFMAFGWIAIRFGQSHDSYGWSSPEAIATICAIAVLVGGVVQLTVLVPSVLSLGFGLSPGFNFKDPWVRLILRRMGPGMLAAGVYPINAVISTMLASNLPHGAQIVLYNSGMMGEMVLGLFAMSLATASLPALSRQAEAKDWEGMRNNLAEALGATGLLVIPASVGLAVLAHPICALIFRTGAYDSAAAGWTATTIMFQCVGLLFVAASRVGTQALYALKDYRGPMVIAVLSMVLNVLLSLLWLRSLGTGGLALANGVSSLAGLIFLAFRLKPRLSQMPALPVLRTWLASLLGAALMGLLAWKGIAWLGLGMPLHRLSLALRLLPFIILCAAVYGGMMLVLGHPQARSLGRKIYSRFSR